MSKYRIDLGLIFPNGSKIAIECDGDKFHGIEDYQDDIMRQKVLERCGWQFIRIRGCEYYSNRANTINNIVEILKDLGYEETSSGVDIRDNIHTVQVQDNDWLLLGENSVNVHHLFDLEDEKQSVPVEDIIPVNENVDNSDKTKLLKNDVKLTENKFESLSNWFISIDAETWFNFSRIGKEKDLLSPMERNFAFNMGRCKKRNWNPSDKQLNFAKKVYDKINNLLKKDIGQENLGF